MTNDSAKERLHGCGVRRPMVKASARILAMGALAAMQACVAQHGVHPLRPLEIATAPYVDVVPSSITGSLAYEGNCLLFREDGTKKVYLPIWPDGSSFNGTSVTFHEPARAEQRVVIGEELSVKGAPASWADLNYAPWEPFHRACRADPFYVRGVAPAN